MQLDIGPWFVLLSGPEDGIDLMPIHFMKGGRLALAPLYLGQLYHMLDESVSKIIESVRRYNVVTHADTRFLQIFS